MSSKRNLKSLTTVYGLLFLAMPVIALYWSAAPNAAWGQDSPETGSSVTATDDSTPGTPESAEDRSSSIIPTNLFQMFTTGNVSWFMMPIVVASIISMWFALERILVLRRGVVIPYAFVTRFLEHLEQDRLDQHLAIKLCDENGSPVARVFEHGVRKWGKPSVEIEQAIIDGGERQVSHLRKHLRVLNGVATVTPLLGLLGTVVGMILAFNQLAAGAAMGKAEQLAGGIGVALLTTAGGLTVAIPSLILYMYLSGRVDVLVMEMDELSQKVVGLISAEALAERKSTRRTTPSPKSKGKLTAESI